MLGHTEVERELAVLGVTEKTFIELARIRPSVSKAFLEGRSPLSSGAEREVLHLLNFLTQLRYSTDLPLDLNDVVRLRDLWSEYNAHRDAEERRASL